MLYYRPKASKVTHHLQSHTAPDSISERPAALKVVSVNREDRATKDTSLSSKLTLEVHALGVVVGYDLAGRLRLEPWGGGALVPVADET